MNPAIQLRLGTLELTLEPALGGCCSALRYHRRANAPVDLLRPLASGITDPFESGCFVLVPYSNRLFGQRLLMRNSEALTLPLNRNPGRHPVHGVGWTKRWNVESSANAHATLAYHHAPDAHWPFEHACTLTVTLTTECARFELALRNLSNDSMPAGLGFHPYFALDPDALVRFAADSVWQQDAEGVPCSLDPVQANPRFDFARLRPAAAVELNHCFANWTGAAELRRPLHGLTVQVTADPGLSHLVVYRPPAQRWICIEPVSHATGALSLERVNHGVRWLAPGATAQASMAIRVLDSTD